MLASRYTGYYLKQFTILTAWVKIAITVEGRRGFFGNNFKRQHAVSETFQSGGEFPLFFFNMKYVMMVQAE